MIVIKPYTLHEFRTQHFVKKINYSASDVCTLFLSV
jgi:hypothetical protein